MDQLGEFAGTCLNIALLVALWALTIVGIGGLARAAQWLFCLGYGC